MAPGSQKEATQAESTSLYRTEREHGWRPPLARRAGHEPPAKRAVTIGRLDR